MHAHVKPERHVPEKSANSLIAKHIENLAKEIREIEDNLSEVVGSKGSVPIKNIQHLQRIDFLRQAVEDLAIIIASVNFETAFNTNDCDTQLKLEASKGLVAAIKGGSCDYYEKVSLPSGEADIF